MSEKKGKDGQIGIGEINTIRQILMGERFQEFEKQLFELKEEVSGMRHELDHSINELKNVIRQDGKNVRMEMLNKIVDLENRMVKNHDKTTQRIKRDKNDHTAKLSKLFLKIGKELSDK